ncbi:MAG: hypothetical protein K8S94_00105 [Planctomycetia bacterium]|nr:hypothetical protein [Planctomycetia bacterium]
MADTLTETEGCNLLTRLFKARGYAIARNVQFREYGVEFHIDGWDAKARVGFEFLTSEDDDHDDLTLEEYNALTTAQRRGELALFIIDEVEPLSAEDLALEAHEFLDELADAAHARLKAAARKKVAKKAAKKKPAATQATARKTVKKAVAKPAKKKAKKAAPKKIAQKARGRRS